MSTSGQSLMTGPGVPVMRDRPEHSDLIQQVDLDAFSRYLAESGWARVDEDDRTSLWSPREEVPDDIRVVLPLVRVLDYEERIYAALRTLAFVERRSPEEIAEDVAYGGSDTVAVRINLEAPPGEAPLPVAYSLVSALRSYVIASAAALENQALVLPARRSRRAESYAGSVRLSTQPGSFILNLALPLSDSLEVGQPGEAPDESKNVIQDPLLHVPAPPFGRRVTSRMASAAQQARYLAEEVGAGRQHMRAFAQARPSAPNATELESLSALGGTENSYRLRFAQTPLAPTRDQPLTVEITPSQQRTMHEAAQFLRTKQPRTDVVVEGYVRRLAQEKQFGPGTIVVEGVTDDRGDSRRFHLELSPEDYSRAVQAHHEGLRVVATGDMVIRGTYTWLRPLRSFDVIPGLGYE
jgi:hypothetical protein